MNDIKDSMRNQGNGYEPKISLVTDYGNQQKSARDHYLNDECSGRSAHHGK